MGLPKRLQTPATQTDMLHAQPHTHQFERSKGALAALAHWFAQGVAAEPEARLVVTSATKDDKKNLQRYALAWLGSAQRVGRSLVPDCLCNFSPTPVPPSLLALPPLTKKA